MKKLSLLFFLAIIMCVVTVGCNNETEEFIQENEEVNLSQEDIKVGFIYNGLVSDGGYTYAHDQGRKYLEKELDVKTTYVESVEEGPECEEVLNEMISQGCNVIFATSGGYIDYVEKVSKTNLDIKFLTCAGERMTGNMGNYFGRMYQTRYLTGIIAGLKTESDIIGYVGAKDIPEVVRGINAFALGVQSVNSDAIVKVKWTNTWCDEDKEYETALALIDEGADVIVQHQDTAGAQHAAEEREVASIGYNVDMRKEAPNSIMTSAVWNWGPYYVDQVQKVIDGIWSAESYWGSLEDKIIKLTSLTKNAPEGAQKEVDEARLNILEGKMKVFAGPIKDQNGVVRVKEGAEITDEELLEFNWFVQGVEGRIEAQSEEDNF